MKDLQQLIDEDHAPSHYDQYIHIIEPWLPPPPCKVVDVGCADGWLMDYLSEKGYACWGVERSEYWYNKGQGKVGQVVWSTHAERMSRWFPPNHIDVVVCTEVLEHCESPYQVLQEIHKILKPNGTLILSVPNILHHENQSYGCKSMWFQVVYVLTFL